MWCFSIMQTQQRSYYCVWWKTDFTDCTVSQPVAKIPQGRENEVLSKMSSTSQQIGHSSSPVRSSGQALYCTLDPSQGSSVKRCCSLQAHFLQLLHSGLARRRIRLLERDQISCASKSSRNFLAYLLCAFPPSAFQSTIHSSGFKQLLRAALGDCSISLI